MELPALQKVVGSDVVAPCRHLDSRTECDVPPGVRSLGSAAIRCRPDRCRRSGGPHDVARRIQVERDCVPSEDRHGQSQPEAIARCVRHVQVYGMNVDDERLGRRTGAEPVTGCQRRTGRRGVPVIDGDLPFVGPQVRGLGLAVSPQTGGCEIGSGLTPVRRMVAARTARRWRPPQPLRSVEPTSMDASSNPPSLVSQRCPVALPPGLQVLEEDDELRIAPDAIEIRVSLEIGVARPATVPPPVAASKRHGLAGGARPYTVAML